MRADLLERSPFNVVQMDLPEAPAGRDPYEHAAETLEAWTLEGVLKADREEALWALEQEYEGPDGSRHTRRGFLCRVRVTDYGPGKVRPHERTQPDRRRTACGSRRRPATTSRPSSPSTRATPGRHLAEAVAGEPWGEATDADGTVNRIVAHRGPRA